MAEIKPKAANRIAIIFIAICAYSAWAEARIVRSTSEVSAFRSDNPCPSTGLRRGACPGYQIDHVDALCAGGADRRDNMQWMTIQEHKWKTRPDVRVCRSLKR